MSALSQLNDTYVHESDRQAHSMRLYGRWPYLCWWKSTHTLTSMQWCAVGNNKKTNESVICGVNKNSTPQCKVRIMHTESH